MQIHQDKTLHTPDLSFETPLSTSTVSPLARTVTFDTDLPGGSIAFYVPGLDEPVIVIGESKILLGRQGIETNSASSSINLSEGGLYLGVSRHHAAITLQNDKYFIEDLASTNGTWVNETRLQPHKAYPLLDGAKVRLGDMVIVVHISSSGLIKDTLHLVPDDPLTDMGSLPRISLSSLMASVEEYLKAVASLQSIVNEAKKRPQIEVVTSAINIDTEGQQIQCVLQNATDTIKFLRKQSKYFVVQSQEIQRAQQAHQSLTQLSKHVASVTKLMMVWTVPLLPPEGQAQYEKRLAPHIRTLLESDLKIVVVS